PRALGSRSILGDARNQEMQTTINLKIKYRESFRPFAPTVLAECISEYFELDRESPYMLLVAPVATNRRTPFERGEQMTLFDIVKQPRSDVPAITHVDYSARIQSVTHRSHPHYYAAINAFREQTGYGVIVNTSFNVRGEPIVCSPYDAYRCFMRTEMDVLMLGNFLLLKEDQPEWPEEKGHIEKYDPSAVAPINDGPFSELLQSIFVNDFLPIAEKVSENESQRVPTAAAQTNSTWRPYPKTLSNGDIFRIPAALDSSQPDIKETVQAMADYWQHDEINAVLEPVVEKLLQVGYEKLSLAEDEEVVEAITDFVYVMY
ncbi:MAG: hypothetical protein GY943_23025, partial [Chloroflexi bacterium]|nr:hypothetical protein [Chloroflexota bacterium]